MSNEKRIDNADVDLASESGLNDSCVKQMIKDHGADFTREYFQDSASEMVERVIGQLNDDAKDHAQEVAMFRG